MTTITTVSEDLKELITQIASADIVKINEVHYIMPDINVKGGTLEQLIESLYDKEDFEIIFVVGEKEFTWWDIREESKLAVGDQWNIDGTLVKFITLQQ